MSSPSPSFRQVWLISELREPLMVLTGGMEWKRAGPSKDQLRCCLMSHPVGRQDFAVLIKCSAPTEPRGGMGTERRLPEDGVA